MSTGEKYLAAAYLVVFAAVLVYLVLIALKVHAARAGPRRADRARDGRGGTAVR